MTRALVINLNFFQASRPYVHKSPLLWWRSDKYLQQLIIKSDLHLIDEILDNKQSVILLAPHTLSLDFGGRALSKFNLLSIYKPFKNNLMNWFIGKSK